MWNSLKYLDKPPLTLIIRPQMSHSNKTFGWTDRMWLFKVFWLFVTAGHCGHLWGFSIAAISAFFLLWKFKCFSNECLLSVAYLLLNPLDGLGREFWCEPSILISFWTFCYKFHKYVLLDFHDNLSHEFWGSIGFQIVFHKNYIWWSCCGYWHAYSNFFTGYNF